MGKPPENHGIVVKTTGTTIENNEKTLRKPQEHGEKHEHGDYQCGLDHDK